MSEPGTTAAASSSSSSNRDDGTRTSTTATTTTSSSATTGTTTTVASYFSACKFTPQPSSSALVAVGGGSSSSGTTTTTTTPTYKSSSFYLDSAGRVQVSLPLQLEFPSKEALERILESNCIQPAPATTTTSSMHENKDDKPKDAVIFPPSSDVSYLFSVEARVTLTYGTGEAISATVESVTIESTRILEGTTILGVSAVGSLRVSRQDTILTSVPGVKLNLEVVAVLTEKKKAVDTSSSSAAVVYSDRSLERRALAAGLRDLYLNRPQQQASDPNTTSLTNARYVITKTKLSPPILCQVSLAHALTVQARSMNGPTPGETWIALTISHSDTHDVPVTITDVILHPAFSKTVAMVLKPGGLVQPQQPQGNVVVDMSQHVQWKFLEGTCNGAATQQFPKTLQPNEAFSTVLYLTAEENLLSRCFSSPISVTATLGGTGADEVITKIVSVVQGHWTSAKRAVTPSNAFRVEFTLPDQVTVGKMFALSLSIQNLGTQRQDLKLVVVNEDNDLTVDNNNNNNNSTGQDETLISFTNTDMMTLVLGDPGKKLSSSSWTKSQLLAVDDSYTLGTINGQQSVDAQLRFIPLQTGTLTLPNLELAWISSPTMTITTAAGTPPPVYKCLHNLQVVATS